MVTYRHERTYGWFLGIALLWTASGMILAKFETDRLNTVLLDTGVTTHVTGTLVDRERMDKGQWRYVLQQITTQEPEIRRMPETIILSARIRDTPAKVGDVVRGLARLSPPSGPALASFNDFGFNAYFAGYGAVGYFYGAPEIVAGDTSPISAHGLAVDFTNQLNRVRSSIGTRIQSILPGDTGAFATSMVTDERRAISDETMEALRLSGLAHIVAISGLNMALASGIFFVGLRSLLSLSPGLAHRINVKKIAAAGALVGLIAYFLISGSAVSAERAFIMMAVILIAVFLDRPAISLRNVALSAVLILIVSPSAVLGPSFQMSFAATLALVSGYQAMAHLPRPENPLGAFPFGSQLASAGRFLGNILLASAIGGASTSIFSLEHFHQVATYGLPANLVAMPAVSFIVMPFGLIAMLLMPFGLDEWPLRIMGFGLDMTIAVAKYIASFGGNIIIGRLNPWVFPLASFGLVLLCLLRTRLRLLGIAVLLAALLVALFASRPPLPDLVIHDDASLAAIVTADSLNTNIEKPPRFIFDQIRYGLNITGQSGPLLVAPIVLPPNPEDQKPRTITRLQREQIIASMAIALSQSQNRFSCAKRQWCAASVRGVAAVVLVDHPLFVGPACDVADMVIVARRLSFQTCRSGALLITQDNLRKRGSLEISFPQTTTEIKTREDFLDQTRI
ncbi:MAG: hypothetical protein RIR97_1108, partial [Pseudomonadota bacterium]